MFLCDNNTITTFLTFEAKTILNYRNTIRRNRWHCSFFAEHKRTRNESLTPWEYYLRALWSLITWSGFKKSNSLYTERAKILDDIRIRILVRDGVNSSNCRNHGVNSANIPTLADLVESVFTPTFSPRVLYDPVRLLLHSDGSVSGWTISYQQHPVV